MIRPTAPVAPATATVLNTAVSLVIFPKINDNRDVRSDSRHSGGWKNNESEQIFHKCQTKPSVLRVLGRNDGRGFSGTGPALCSATVSVAGGKRWLNCLI